MKKVISVIAILLLLVGSLAACSEEAPPAEKLDDISGIWVAEADYGEIIKQAINTNNNKDLEKHLKLGEFKVQIEFVFNADGTYQRSRLAEFSEKDLAAMKKALKAGYIAFYENTLGEEVLQGRTGERCVRLPNKRCRRFLPGSTYRGSIRWLKAERSGFPPFPIRWQTERTIGLIPSKEIR